MNYELIYNAANESYSGWVGVVIGLSFSIIAAALVFSPSTRTAIFSSNSFFFKPSDKFTLIFSKVYLAFCLVFTVSAGTFPLLDYNEIKSASKTNSCTITEGVIKNFELKELRHRTIKFEVKGVQFRYTNEAPTYGFNNRSTNSTSISEGLQVRVCHIKPKRKDGRTSSRVIARLEIISP